jgi:hypothetical protein
VLRNLSDKQEAFIRGDRSGRRKRRFEILRNPVVKAAIAAALAKTASQILGNPGVKAGQDHNRGGPVARAGACRLLLGVVVQAVHACRRPGRQ